MFNIVVMFLYLRVFVSMPLPGGWRLGVGRFGARWYLEKTNMHSSKRPFNILDLAHRGIGQESVMISRTASWKHTLCASTLLSTPIVKYAGKALKAWTQFALPWNIFHAWSKTGVFEGLLWWGWSHQPLLMLWKQKGLGNNLLQKKMVDNKVKCTQGRGSEK